MTLLISYTNYYGAYVFFLPGAHSMLKPALICTECGEINIYILINIQTKYLFYNIH